MKNKSCYFILFFIFSNFISSQNNTEEYTINNKGKFFISWGGNRASYSKSDIRFYGNNYDFEIKDATAKDKPKGWHIDYINPTRITIPQTNAKLGYFLSNKYIISIGLDHMKYVMERNKNRVINGFINLPEDNLGNIYNGIYNNYLFNVSEDFLKFEHTDGLNYIFTEFTRYDDISLLFNLRNTEKFQVNITEGLGGGILYPKTNTTLLNKQRHDDFHFSGFGLHVSMGLNLTFFKHFFIQGDLKGGYINMTDIRTTSIITDRAEQSFYFFERVISIGGIFRIK